MLQQTAVRNVKVLYLSADGSYMLIASNNTRIARCHTLPDLLLSLSPFFLPSC